MLVGETPCDLVVPRQGQITFEVLPPRDRQDDGPDRLYVKSRTVPWNQIPDEGGVLYFDLRLEAVEPTQPVEIRHR
jgi:hypothetical protein